MPEPEIAVALRGSGPAPWTRWAWLLAVAVVAALTVRLIVAVVHNHPGTYGASLPGALVPLLLVAGVAALWLFTRRTAWFLVHRDAVVIDLRRNAKRMGVIDLVHDGVKLANVVDVQAGEVRGLRAPVTYRPSYGQGNPAARVRVSNGPAVWLRIEWGHDWVIPVDDPIGLAAAINERRPAMLPGGGEPGILPSGSWVPLRPGGFFGSR